MKTCSIMETRHNLARVLRVVESGQEVEITGSHLTADSPTSLDPSVWRCSIRQANKRGVMNLC